MKRRTIQRDMDCYRYYRRAVRMTWMTTRVFMLSNLMPLQTITTACLAVWGGWYLDVTSLSAYSVFIRSVHIICSRISIQYVSKILINFQCLQIFITTGGNINFHAIINLLYNTILTLYWLVTKQTRKHIIFKSNDSHF